MWKRQNTKKKKTQKFHNSAAWDLFKLTTLLALPPSTEDPTVSHTYRPCPWPALSLQGSTSCNSTLNIRILVIIGLCEGMQSPRRKNLIIIRAVGKGMDSPVKKSLSNHWRHEMREGLITFQGLLRMLPGGNVFDFWFTHAMCVCVGQPSWTSISSPIKWG